jgi:hypothetical protein
MVEFLQRKSGISAELVDLGVVLAGDGSVCFSYRRGFDPAA